VKDRLASSARLRVLILVALVFAGLAAFLWYRTRQVRLSGNDIPGYSGKAPAPVPTNSTSPTLFATTSPTPTSSVVALDSTPTPSAEETPPAPNTGFANSYVGTIQLVIPVAGVRPEQLIDTFSDARSEGRVHDAIDIPAPAGTPVIAAADGQIVKLFQSERGGTTIYQASVDRKLIFYYAHLQRYADGLVEGNFVKQGETIAYVGDTGNAGAGNFHLHFSIAAVADAKRYWEGTNINPYPLLRH
jgi:peptidoglycan LD-endopeptidase LytH